MEMETVCLVLDDFYVSRVSSQCMLLYIESSLWKAAVESLLRTGSTLCTPGLVRASLVLPVFSGKRITEFSQQAGLPRAEIGCWSSETEASLWQG